MKYLLAFLLACGTVASANEDSVSLKPGDTLRIMFDDGSDSGLEIKVTAIAKAAVAQEPVAAPAEVYETVYEQVCVGGVCSFQPVRRLVHRTATAVSRVATTTAAVFAPMAGGCGCGCPACNCGTAATMTTVFAAPRGPRPVAVFRTRQRWAPFATANARWNWRLNN